MQTLWNAVAAVARVAIWCGGAMLFVAAGIVTAEVLTRKALPSLIDTVEWLAARISPEAAAAATRFDSWAKTLVFSGSDELSAYLFAVGTSWSLAHVLMTRGHVRIDALYGRLGPRARALLDLAALLVLAVFVGALLERAWNVASTSYLEEIRSNTPLRIWLAWPQVPWFAGIALFFLAIVLTFLRSLGAVLRGDFGAAAAIAGVPSQDEEIKGELEGLGIQAPSPLAEESSLRPPGKGGKAC